MKNFTNSVGALGISIAGKRGGGVDCDELECASPQECSKILRGAMRAVEVLLAPHKDVINACFSQFCWQFQVDRTVKSQNLRIRPFHTERCEVEKKCCRIHVTQKRTAILSRYWRRGHLIIKPFIWQAQVFPCH